MRIEQLSVSLSLCICLPTPGKRMTFSLPHPFRKKQNKKKTNQEKNPGVANGVTTLLEAELYYR